MGRVAQEQQQFKQAEAYYQQALALKIEFNDRYSQANTYHSLGKVAQEQSEFEQAKTYFLQALSLYAEFGDHYSQTRMYQFLGEIEEAQQQWKQAELYYQQALVLSRELNNSDNESKALEGLGTVYASIGSKAEAIEYLEQSRTIAQKSKDYHRQSDNHAKLARAYAILGDYERALHYSQSALTIMREQGDERGINYRLTDLGDTLIMVNQTAQAVKPYLQALEIARSLDDQQQYRLLLEKLAQTYQKLGQVDDALHYYNQLLDRVRIIDRQKMADLLVNMGELMHEHERVIEAVQFWTEAEKFYVELQLPEAQSIALRLANLEASHFELLKLFDLTKQYMTDAGFEVTYDPATTLFLCDPKHHVWREYLQKAVPVKVLSDIALNMDVVQKLVVEGSQLLGETPHCIIVICNHTPTNDAWLQIATQRAVGIIVMPVDDSILRTGLQQNRQLTILLDYLKERYLGRPHDLYDRQNPISDRLNFFGREKLAKELSDALNQGHALALFGLRKMGKTSLLKYMSDGLTYPVAVIDLQTGVEPGQLYDSILDEWENAVRIRHPDVVWERPSLRGVAKVGEAFTTAVRDLLRLLEMQPTGLSDGLIRAQVAVFVDEIEEIYPYTEADLERYLAFARIMRGLAQQYPGKFGLVVAGVDPNIVRTDGLFGRRNPFYSFFQTKYLQPLNKEDCKQMIRNIGVQMGLNYTEDALDFVAKMSGGHPYWARKLCSLAFQEHEGAEAITRTQLQEIAERFIEEPATAFLLNQRGLWGDVTNPQFWSTEEALANKQILLKLAEVERSTSKELLAKRRPRSAYSHALLEMNARSILNQSTADSYWIHLQLFRQWIQYEMLEEG